MAGLGWATEAAGGGAMDAVQKLIEQRMAMARDAETVRSHMANEAQAKARLDEDAAYRHQVFGAEQADRDITAGKTLGSEQSIGNDVTDIAPALLKGQQSPNMSAPAFTPIPAAGLAPPPGIADPTQDQNAPLPAAATGGGPYVPNAPSLDSPTVTKRITWLGTPDERKKADLEQKNAAYGRSLTPGSDEDKAFKYRDATGAQIPPELLRDRGEEERRRQEDAEERLRLAASLRPGKQPSGKLSAQGTSALRAIEGAGPLTDQAIAMMEKEFPGIEKNGPGVPEQYNGVADKAQALYHKGKYYTGFADENDPRLQLVSLLKPIQAGQYTQSSRSYKMVELALEHMADMGQTPARMYESLKNLRGLMPELRQGVIRAEQPVDFDNPLAGSYFDPNKKGAPGAPAAAGAPKNEIVYDSNGKPMAKQP